MIRTIELVLTATESYLPGDFVVYRALPRRELRRVGGFVFLDHFDQPDITHELFDVPPHPHIGLQTVTYLFDGEILHTDSLDNQCEIRPGDVNWMTAGRGITHAEQVTRLQPRVHGLQSWVGLPHDKRKVEPAFEHYPASEIPGMKDDIFTMRVIAGEMGIYDSPIKTHQSLTYVQFDAHQTADLVLRTDPNHELALYICEGALTLDGGFLRQHDLGLLSSGDKLSLHCRGGSRFVLFGGEPLPDPTVIYWNFVTDTVGEAKQAAIDWEDGKFPPVSKYRKFTSVDLGDEAERMQLL